MDLAERSIRKRALHGDLDAIVQMQQRKKEFETVDIAVNNVREAVIFTYELKEKIPSTKPAVILIPGIRNHPLEWRSHIRPLLDAGAPSVNVVQFPFDRPLDVNRFIAEIGDIITTSEKVVLGGVCLGGTIAAELVYRMPHDLRGKIHGLFLVSPTLSNDLKFARKPMMRVASILGKLVPVQVIEKFSRLAEKAAGEAPAMATVNALRLVAVEQELSFFADPNSLVGNAQVPNMVIAWVSTKKEYMLIKDILRVENRIRLLAQGKPVTYRGMPGTHGDIDKKEWEEGYRKILLEWYSNL